MRCALCTQTRAKDDEPSRSQVRDEEQSTVADLSIRTIPAPRGVRVVGLSAGSTGSDLEDMP